jgi:hypothetical protein
MVLFQPWMGLAAGAGVIVVKNIANARTRTKKESVEARR